MPFDSQSDEEPPSTMDLIMQMTGKDGINKKRPLRILNDGVVVGVDLEDGTNGLGDQTYDRSGSQLSLI